MQTWHVDVWNSFMYSFMNSFINSFIHPFIFLFFYLFIYYLFINLLTYLLWLVSFQIDTELTAQLNPVNRFTDESWCWNEVIIVTCLCVCYMPCETSGLPQQHSLLTPDHCDPSFELWPQWGKGLCRKTLRWAGRSGRRRRGRWTESNYCCEPNNYTEA